MTAPLEIPSSCRSCRHQFTLGVVNASGELCCAQCEKGPAADNHGLVWSPLPRVQAKDLDYFTFLREFALPQRPFILVDGTPEEWTAKATDGWSDLSYFLEAADINRDHATEFSTFARPFDPEPVKETMAVGEALKELYDRKGWEAPSEVQEQPRYLANWAYDGPGGSGSVEADISPPILYFDRSTKRLAESEILGKPGRNLKWLFIGESGSGSPSHLDTMNTSAWLWCACGRKEWRCLHGGDFGLIGSKERAVGHLPDLFDPDTDMFPWLRQGRLYWGVQEPGDIVFTPSCVYHAVRNVEFTISVTHNYADATNIAEVLKDRIEQLQRSHIMLDSAYVITCKLALKQLFDSRSQEEMLKAVGWQDRRASEIVRLVKDHWIRAGLGGELDLQLNGEQAAATNIKRAFNCSVCGAMVCPRLGNFCRCKAGPVLVQKTFQGTSSSFFPGCFSPPGGGSLKQQGYGHAGAKAHPKVGSQLQQDLQMRRICHDNY